MRFTSAGCVSFAGLFLALACGRGTDARQDPAGNSAVRLGPLVETIAIDAAWGEAAVSREVGKPGAGSPRKEPVDPRLVGAWDGTDRISLEEFFVDIEIRRDGTFTTDAWNASRVAGQRSGTIAAFDGKWKMDFGTGKTSSGTYRLLNPVTLEWKDSSKAQPVTLIWKPRYGASETPSSRPSSR